MFYFIVKKHARPRTLENESGVVLLGALDPCEPQIPSKESDNHQHG